MEHCTSGVVVYSLTISPSQTSRFSISRKSKQHLSRIIEWNMIPSGSADDTKLTTTTPTAAAAVTQSSPLLPPPIGVDYSKNPTVFGKILQGSSKAKILAESPDLLAFQDILPRAPLHGLVVSKRYIPTIQDVHVETNGAEMVNDSCKESMEMLLHQMEEMAHGLLKHHLTPQQYQDRDYILCFHIPPFNSVDHLHLHVLAPASQMQWIWKDVKYNTNKRWCISLEEVQARIQRGRSAVPYAKTDPWWKIAYQVFCPAHSNQ